MFDTHTVTVHYEHGATTSHPIPDETITKEEVENISDITEDTDNNAQSLVTVNFGIVADQLNTPTPPLTVIMGMAKEIKSELSENSYMVSNHSSTNK